MAVSYDFTGQTAIVTGGARGIGRAVAAQLALSGARVWIWDIDPIDLEGARNMGSLAGKEGLRNLAAYSAAIAGVIAFTKALARELGDSEIRVNCVAPGPIDTDLIRRLGNEVVDAMIAASPLKRLGNAGEVAALILWLCSDASTFNTGAVFDMSGGRARY